MTAKTDSWENALLLLLFNNTGAANIGDATGLRGSTTAGQLFLSLHTADPGETGNQSTSEVAYTSYARVGINRASGAGGFTVTGNSVSPTTQPTSFPAATGGSATATHFGIGTASSGAGVLLYRGALSASIAISSGVTPQLSTLTGTED
ncbi:MAG: hypothetical protein CFE27_14930 [Alphaproteobacteria bacterium PA1]|nr:MAG: hypothetical protein CFE27_14930 [Alphaproteobacteria bacterium PA1]